MPSSSEPEATDSRREKLLQDVLENTSTLSAALTREGIILATSARFAEMLKISRKELKGAPFQDLIAPEERSGFLRLLAQSTQQRASVGEVVLRNMDVESIFTQILLRRMHRPYPDVILLLALDTTRHHRFAERLRRQKAEMEARVGERIAQLAEANRALATQKALLERVLEQLPDPLLVIDVERRILLANPASRRLVDADPRGMSFDEARSRLGEFFGTDGRPIPPDEDPLVKALHGEACVGREVLSVRASGERRIFLINAMPLLDEHGQNVGAISHFAEVTHLRGVTGEMPARLDNEDVLLRELRHRFRNNLAILASLLGLHSDSVTSEEARAALEESRQRVYSMARLHDQLHLGGSLEAVQMGAYLDGLVANLARSYGRPTIQVLVSAEPVTLDPERASSVGLIVNELVTNAFKHAFRGADTGEIGVGLEEIGEEYRLHVWDTGTGFLSDDTPEHSASFGLRLVNLLVRRLDGTLSSGATAGSRFTITFPIKPMH